MCPIVFLLVTIMRFELFQKYAEIISEWLFYWAIWNPACHITPRGTSYRTECLWMILKFANRHELERYYETKTYPSDSRYF